MKTKAIPSAREPLPTTNCLARALLVSLVHIGRADGEVETLRTHAAMAKQVPASAFPPTMGTRRPVLSRKAMHSASPRRPTTLLILAMRKVVLDEKPTAAKTRGE
jgi:hypothetical protein